MTSKRGSWFWLVVFAWLAACRDAPPVGLDDTGPADADSDADADADDDGGPHDTGPPGPRCLQAISVDMLWIIDDSHSMQEEQQNLAANFPVLMEALTAPVDVDGDGIDDFPPVDDLRVGVISTNMGVGDRMVLGCDALGDEGSMVSASRSDAEGCVGLTIGPPPWLEYHAGDDAEDFAQRFSCLARLGTEGCGYEQHLDSALAALTERAASGEPHEGFLRQDSLIVLVFVTDEDDCSTLDDALFDSTPLAIEEYGLPGTRCALNDDMLHPISHYFAGLDPLRLDRAGGLAVAVIAGVPVDAVADPQAVDYDVLLADERMVARPDDDNPSQLAPACSLPQVGSAAPARRLTELVRDVAPGDRGLVASICQVDLSPTMRAIADMIARRLCDRPE